MFEVLREEMILENDSKKSIDAYVYHNKKFLEFAKKKPHQVTNEDVRKYLLHLNMNSAKPTTIRLAISALTKYYRKIMKRNIMKDFSRSRLPKKIVKTLKREEIIKMIEVTTNSKHRLLIELIYSAGLRVGEAVRIRKEDILEKENGAIIRQGKGKKDRFVKLSDRFLNDYSDYQVSDYLFESSYNKGKHISIRTAELIIINAAKKAGVEKNVYPHMLRASYATHLLNNGVPLHDISALLGHSNIETTRKAYINMDTRRFENIKSPLD